MDIEGIRKILQTNQADPNVLIEDRQNNGDPYTLLGFAVAHALGSGGASKEIASENTATCSSGSTQTYRQLENKERFAKSCAILKLLLDNGADPNNGGPALDVPLVHAAHFNNKDVVNLLCENSSVELNRRSDIHKATALEEACEEGHEEIVQILKNKRASVDIASEFGEFPIVIAIRKDHFKTAKLLKDEVNKVCATTDDTTLHMIMKYCGNNALEASQMISDLEPNLIKHINSKNRLGQTPLMLAAACTYNGASEYRKLPREKLEKIAELPELSNIPKEALEKIVTQVVSEQSRTPEANTKLIRWLLKKGADPTITDKNGKNALYYASSAREKNQEVIKLLTPTQQT